MFVLTVATMWTAQQGHADILVPEQLLDLPAHPT
jgi:hypothetical protein